MAAFTVVLYLGLNNLDKVFRAVQVLYGLLTPFIIGLVIAFILNRPMGFLYRKVFAPLCSRKGTRWQAAAKPLSLVCTYLLLAAALGVCVSIVAPQIGASVVQLGKTDYLSRLQSIANQVFEWVDLSPEILSEINQQLRAWVEKLMGFLISSVPQMLDFLVSFGGGIITSVISLIVSIYLLLSKEQLLSQLSRICRAFLPAKQAQKLSETASISVGIFNKYLMGQLTDALIVGVVSVVLLSIFRFPYAMLIGVVMGVTNIIPFFGPFIGAVPGVLLILIFGNPFKALWYILLVVVIQQIDGNIIAPRIIGGSVGLPPLWVLFAVTVGGGLFSVPGMILGTPCFAILYTLLARAVRAREGAAPVKGEGTPPV